jgi:hypothetical protein
VRLCGLQANPIFGYSFYSFPYSLDFRVKRYQWYQSARSISRFISSAVRVCAFACLKSTLSRIALGATSSVHERPDLSRPHRWIFPPEGNSRLDLRLEPRNSFRDFTEALTT